MQIDGTWAVDPHGVTSPILTAHLIGAGGSHVPCTFLVDTGAEVTVLTYDVFQKLGLPTQPAQHQLAGLGGIVVSAVVDTVLLLTLSDGTTTRVRNMFNAEAHPPGSDISLLGRDVLNYFTLIVDRPNWRVHLLVGQHNYVIQGP